MIDMNIKSNNSCSSTDEHNSCPMLYLTDDQVEALGITTAPAAGTTFTLQCKAVAIRVTSEVEEAAEGEGDAPDVSLTLRITAMELQEDRSAASMLYPDK